jgi:hypothetical protein
VSATKVAPPSWEIIWMGGNRFLRHGSPLSYNGSSVTSVTIFREADEVQEQEPGRTAE